jgi:hypothetical protein
MRFTPVIASLLLLALPVRAQGVDEDTLVLVDEEEGDSGPEASPALSCPACDLANFYVTLELVGGADLQHETPDEDINDGLLRLASGFMWKKADGVFAAKADARLDVFVSGKEDAATGDWVLSRSEVSFEPREWYVEIVTRPVDVRIGSQMLRFSRCDLLAPGDLLAPYDLREPYRGQWSIVRLPVIAVRTDWKPLTDLLITLVLVPFYTPAAYDLFGTDQAILGPNAPPGIGQYVDTIERLVDPSVADRVRHALVATKVPEEWGPNQSVALRVEKLSELFDAGFTYLFTFGPMPALTVNPDLATALYLFANGAPDVAGEMLSAMIAGGEEFVTTRWKRLHVFVVDASAEAGPVVLSGEAGWIPEMTFSGVDLARLPVPLVNVRTGLMTASLQAQYTYGELLTVAAEAAFVQMLGPRVVQDGGGGGGIPPVLLFGDQKRQVTIGLATRLALLHGKLEWRVTGQAGVLDRSLIFSTRLSYEIGGRFKPFVGAVAYEVFGDRPDPDLSIAASRDFNDEIFFGFEVN